MTDSTQRIDDSMREEDLLLDDYESDAEISKTASNDDQFSSSTLALLEQLKPVKTSDTEEEIEDRRKIIFCSRTHSQLTQFVNELLRVNLPSAYSNIDEEESIKHVPLGSRKNLCINSKVSKLASTVAINERCLELQKPGISSDHKCEFFPSQRSNQDKERIDDFKDNTIAQIQDIEDIASLGRKMKLCPYYASRSAIPVAEVLTLPYPLLLLKSAREATGVSIKDNVVIIDEAHNLMSAIADTMSVSTPLSHLVLAHKQLMGYCQKFKNRLKGKNRVYIAQIIRLLKACITRLQTASNATSDTVLPANELISNVGADQIQPYKLVKYIQESKLTYKVEGYAELLDQSTINGNVVQAQRQQQPKGVLAEFQTLLVALMNPGSEGRFFITRNDREPTLKYSLLDPQAHFEDIVQEARAVILAGGTMSPMSDYSDQLFPYLKPERLKTFSFGHIIDKGNVYMRPLSKGPTGIEFDFTWQNRESQKMVLELAAVVEKMCTVAPDGMVVFFPSYDYLTFVVSVWKSGNNSAFSRIAQQKQIFQESKDINVDDLLTDYATVIASGTGALMLAVVGGKLSEGINFSNRLGRVVICVGLPYPNIKSAEWLAKVEYIERMKYTKCKEEGSSEAVCKSKAQMAGREYADNTTMRAVNQSIGRAIRHRNDYAAIFLVDKRYATPRIQAKLPAWLKNSVRPGEAAWHEIEKDCSHFFARMDSR